MHRFNTVGVLVAALVMVFATCSSPAYAAKPGGAYSCRGDKQLDVPMQFAIDVQSAARVHVSAYGGSDKSTYVVPYSWRLYNSAGAQVDYFPRTPLAFVSPNMLRETNLEGLVPAASYTIELTSRDFCNNLNVVRKSVTMPALTAESNPAAVSTPAILLVGLQAGQFKQVQFSVTDDTGAQDVAVLVNGTMLAHYTYENGVSFRWWSDNYADDGVQSVLEGPNYYLSYPDSYIGTYSLVEVIVVDSCGNTATESASLVL